MNHNNSGFILKKYDSLHLGLLVTLLWPSYLSLLSTFYGEDYFQSTGLFTIGQIVYLGSIFNALPAIIKGKSRRWLSVFVCFFILFYIISSIFCSDIVLKKQVNRTIALWSLPYFFLSIRLDNHEDFWKKMKFISLMIVISEFIHVIIFPSIQTYSQDVGYSCLIPFISFWLCFVNEKKIIYLLPFALSFVIIVLSGSRGPLMCAVISFLMAFLFNNGLNRRNIILALLAVILYYLYTNFQAQILSWAISMTTSLNASSRSLELLLSNSIADDDIRSRMREVAFDYSINHPLIGSGFFNDRIYMASKMSAGSIDGTIFGSYCHNFFLEILMQFGFIPGLVILWIFFKSIYKRIKYSESVQEKNIIFVAVSIGFLPLLVSRSWLTYQYFYFLVGILFSYNTKSLTIKK